MFEAGGRTRLFSCPENILTQFSGPGLGQGNRNTFAAGNQLVEFISIGPVPEYRTHVDLSPVVGKPDVGQLARYYGYLQHKRSPILPAGFNGGDLNDFKAAPPYSITYGISPVVGMP